MRVGVLMRYTPEDLKFVTDNGFGSVELLIWPGFPLDPASSKSDDWKRAKDDFAAVNVEVSAIGFYPNMLDPKPAERKAHAKHLVSLMRVARVMGVRDICTFAGRIPGQGIPENIPAFKQVFTPLVKRAEDAGLRISFENCPGGNIAYIPRAWDLMFDAVPSESLGLEYDPSHLICLLIDPVDVIYEFGKKIFHVHAKDAEVMWKMVRRNGITEPGTTRHRMPGMGQADFGRIINALVEVGYRGNLDIEGRHDPVYRDDMEHAGLLIAKKHLEQFVA